MNIKLEEKKCFVNNIKKITHVYKSIYHFHITFSISQGVVNKLEIILHCPFDGRTWYTMYEKIKIVQANENELKFTT